MRISFGELKIGDTARKYISQALDSNWVSGGPLVEEFEKQWSKKFGYKHSLAMSSGTDAGTAMCAMLYDFGAKRGDEIICPASCFVSVANSILAAGFIPKFVDINQETLNIDYRLIEKAISTKTVAIKVVHNMGKPCDMDEISAIAKNNKIALLEDNCEAHGAIYKDKIVGSFGLAGSFSFYAAHMVVCGEGGMVSTNSDSAYQTLASVRTHGRKNGKLFFNFERFGLNFKMNDMEAAIGLESIQNFNSAFNKRRENTKILRQMLADLNDKIIVFQEKPHEIICPHAFPLLCKDVNDKQNLYDYLESNSIQCKTLFGSLPTQHKAFNFLGHSVGDFPVAENVGLCGLHFGLHQYLTDDDIKYVSDTIHKFFGRTNE